MKHFSLLLLCVFIEFITSCTRVLMITEGIKQPALENHTTLSKFLLSKGIDTTEILCFKDTTALIALYRSHIGIPDARFFNSKKKLVDYKNHPNDCNGMVSVFIEKIDSIVQKTPIEGEFLDNYINNLVIEKTGQKFLLEDQDYDVYMVVYWAKFLGKVNKRKVYDWQEHVKKANQNGKKIRMMLVSVDYQAFWGISKDQLPTFDY